jgi:hypothetical protein
MEIGTSCSRTIILIKMIFLKKWMNVAMGCPIRDQVKSLTHLDEIEKLEKFQRLSSLYLSPERAK